MSRYLTTRLDDRAMAGFVSRALVAALFLPLLLVPSARAGALTQFGGPQARYHPTAIAPYRFVDTVITLRFDFTRGIVYGRERVVLVVKRRPLLQLPFDSAEIDYRDVFLNGRASRFIVDNHRQTVDVLSDRPLHPGETITVDFRYSAKPMRGIYFIRPDTHYPRITPEIWTQGEPVDNRRWFPTWDEPNEKTPSELIVDVPNGWTVVANGYLKGVRHSASSTSWDWRSPQRKSTYLIAFVAGPLVRYHRQLGRLPIDSFVQPPDRNLNPICFGDTPNMVAYYGKLFGVAYPFSKYDQTAAERFIFGGMENESAATESALALHPLVEDLEDSCDDLVSHELAQNWFGDYATMADWSNAWLNEGFATYFEEVWTEHQSGEPAFEYDRYLAEQAYASEAQQYRRPIVDYVYDDPIDLLDTSGHERAAAVIHMLRYLYGDRRFYAALHHYLVSHAFENADTNEFFRSVGESLHVDLTWFAREWFFQPDIPHYTVSDAYDATRETLRVHVRQATIGAHLFEMPVVIEVHAAGRVYRQRITLRTGDSTVLFPGIRSKPEMVLFDPNENLLKTLVYPKPLAALTYQLRYAAHVGDRHWALDQLSVSPTGVATASAVRQILRSVIDGDAFYGMRADAVTAAAGLNDSAALDQGLEDRDKRVRLAAATAAARLTTPAKSLIGKLSDMTGDPDPLLASAAWASLGALHAPDVHARLVRALNIPSFRAAVAIGALKGLAAEGEAESWPLIVARTSYGTQEQERDAAIGALAQLARKLRRERVAATIIAPVLESDPLVRSRVAAARALALLGGAEAAAALCRAIRRDPDEVVHDFARDALTTVAGAHSSQC